MLFMPLIKAFKAFMINFAQYQNEMNISWHGLTIFSKTFVKYIKCNIKYLHPSDVPMRSFFTFYGCIDGQWKLFNVVFYVYDLFGMKGIIEKIRFE